MADSHTARPAAILFDIDGTIVVRSSAHLGVLADVALRTLDVDVAFDLSSEAPRMDGIDVSGWIDAQIWRAVMARAGLDPSDRRLLSQLVSSYADAYAVALSGGTSAGRAIPGAGSLIARLAGEHTPLALVTGNAHGIARVKLQSLSLASHFEFDPNAGFGDWRADRAALPPAALRRLGVPADRFSHVVLVGDTIADIRSARANGMVAIGVTTGAHDSTELRRAGASSIVTCLAELPPLLGYNE